VSVSGGIVRATRHSRSSASHPPTNASAAPSFSSA